VTWSGCVPGLSQTYFPRRAQTAPESSGERSRPVAAARVPTQKPEKPARGGEDREGCGDEEGEPEPAVVGDRACDSGTGEVSVLPEAYAITGLVDAHCHVTADVAGRSVVRLRPGVRPTSA
jgi:hypothetical protein